MDGCGRGEGKTAVALFDHEGVGSGSTQVGRGVGGCGWVWMGGRDIAVALFDHAGVGSDSSQV